MNFGKYINIPYRNKGRDFNGVDCFGLIWLIYKSELEIDLPDFTELNYHKNWYEEKEEFILDNFRKYEGIKWKKVDKPYKLFDALIFYNRCEGVIANHIGLFIGGNKFLHVNEKNSSQVDRLNRYWGKRLYNTVRLIDNV